MDSFLIVPTKTDLARIDDKGQTNWRGVFGLSFSVVDEPDGSGRYAALNGMVSKRGFEDLSARIKQINEHVRIKVGDVAIHVVNDMRGDVDVLFDNGYLDGEPVLYGNRVMKRRTSLRYVIGDVSRDLAIRDEHARVLAVSLPAREEAKDPAAVAGQATGQPPAAQ